ncbi:DUF4185 domain-containing protein [Rhodococcus sp. O3]|uniref:DUF4185 domain-containing protein n=1 Tax=Rhodococcus sp. O3 TaxID=3404919 RepID=UPI003B6778DA
MRSLVRYCVTTATVTALTLTLGAALASANPNAINPIPGLNGVNGVPQLGGRARAVAQQTGILSQNRTQDLNVLGTDLGIMWDNGRGEILTAFGDTAGLGLPNLLSGSLWAWRSNVLFRSNDRDLSNGMDFSSAVTDAFGQAKELIPSPKIPFVEISRIPTAGVAVGDTQYLSAMSVKNWGPAGTWETNYSGLIFSNDNGENWAPAPETVRPSEGGNRNFQMSAFLKRDGFVYQYGTPPGRGGLVHLARVPEAQIRDLGAYEYWDGGAWVRDVNAARPLMGDGVAELSVQWNDYLGQFLMLTTDAHNSVVMRRAPSATGPWSPPEVIVDTRELPSAYGAYIHPWSSGPDLYFLTTVHQNYNVLLMHTTLHR